VKQSKHVREDRKFSNWRKCPIGKGKRIKNWSKTSKHMRRLLLPQPRTAGCPY
jgi:hypothetical protein